MSDDAQFDSELRLLIDLRRQLAKATAEKDDAARRKKAQEAKVFELIENRKDLSVKRDLGPGYGVVRFVPRSTDFAQILDAETAVAALEAEGRGDEAFRREPRKKQLNELVRERLETKQPLPEGIGFYTNTGVTVTHLG